MRHAAEPLQEETGAQASVWPNRGPHRFSCVRFHPQGMAGNIYNMRTLNDNWFEDRLQPAGGLSATGSLHLRKSRAYETDMASIAEKFDVLGRISRMPARESYATPNDGFREVTKTSEDFAHPRSRKEFVANPPKKPTMLTTESVPEVSHEERRPLPGNSRGFGAVLNRHEEGHEQRFFNTTTGDFFGGERTRTLPAKTDPHMLGSAGVGTAHIEKRVSGMKVGKLCGESINESGEAGKDTRIQRSWIYGTDPALRHVDRFGGTRPDLPRNDSDLSLPLGAGAMSKIRADLEERRGRLYRTATMITKGNDKRSGITLFRDD